MLLARTNCLGTASHIHLHQKALVTLGQVHPNLGVVGEDMNHAELLIDRNRRDVWKVVLGLEGLDGFLDACHICCVCLVGVVNESENWHPRRELNPL